MSVGTNGTSENLAIFIDTQAIVWAIVGSSKLSSSARDAITSGDSELLISVVTAFEFVDLNRRGRFGVDLPFETVLRQLDANVIDYPAAAWMIAERLPPIHFDPVDRMLVAHVIHADEELVTADALIHRYPVRTLW